MNVLVINSGSSSIKYKLINTAHSRSLCKGIVERIGTQKAILSHQRYNHKPFINSVKAHDHNAAILHIFKAITEPGMGVIRSHSQIACIGHRVVHGAEVFTEPAIINNEVIKAIKKFSELAPLHNPPALLGINACRRFSNKIPQVAVFDTAFHQSMPESAYLYAISYKFYKRYGIRRYGFHGTSHMYVADEAARRLRKSIKSLNIITCHLGNGCSITAVKNGKSVDTSMGFTPLEGLIMGTRSGDIDVAMVLYLMEKEGLGTKKMNWLLNHQSGLLGISGVSNDMRDILQRAKKGNKRCLLAIDMFIHRIVKYVGAYTAVMGGVDAIVLTAGIGENSVYLKNELEKRLRHILIKYSAKIMVIPTDEELMIAKQAAMLIKKTKRHKT